MNDNEKFMDLYKNAETNEEKRKILRDYQTFNLKIFELLFGNRMESVNANLNVGLNTTADAVMDRLRSWDKKKEEFQKKEPYLEPVVEYEKDKELHVELDPKSQPTKYKKKKEEDEEEILL